MGSANLAELDNQDGLILLHKSLQADLRHLKRTLGADDIPNAWITLDAALFHARLFNRSSP